MIHKKTSIRSLLKLGVFLFLVSAVHAAETNVVTNIHTNFSAKGKVTISSNVHTNIIDDWTLMQQGKMLWGKEMGDSLYDLFSRAEHQNRYGYAQLALALYQYIERAFTSNELAQITIDGCSGRFLLDAGLCRSYRLAGPGADGKNLEKAYFHGMRARHRAMNYESGGHIKRFARLLMELSLLPEKNPGELRDFIDHALDLHPGLPSEMIIIKENQAKGIQAEGDWRGAANAFADLLTRAPYYQATTYARCGKLFALREDYRSAFTWWITGLKNMQPINFYSHARYVPNEVFEFFAFATREEIEDYRAAIRGVAARFPANQNNISQIAQWLQFANAPRVLFELKVRDAVDSGDAEALTNLWKEGATRYRNPEYARRLGDYDTYVQIYTSKMYSEPWPYLTQKAEPCCAERIEQYIDKLPVSALRQYRDMLQRRADQFRKHENLKVRKLVATIDARIIELDGMITDKKKTTE